MKIDGALSRPTQLRKKYTLLADCLNDSNRQSRVVEKLLASACESKAYTLGRKSTYEAQKVNEDTIELSSHFCDCKCLQGK